MFRIKGFLKDDSDSWVELNATRRKTEIQPIPDGQDIIIVIGSDLSEKNILAYFE